MWSSPSSSSCPPRRGSRRGARTADAPPLGRRLERPTICCCGSTATLLGKARHQERGLNGRRYVSGRDTPGASGVVRPRSAETGRHLPLCCGTEPPERVSVCGGAAWFPCGAQLPRRSLIPRPRRRIFHFRPAPPKTHRPSAALAPPRGESRRSAGTCGCPERRPRVPRKIRQRAEVCFRPTIRFSRRRIGSPPTVPVPEGAFTALEIEFL